MKSRMKFLAGLAVLMLAGSASVAGAACTADVNGSGSVTTGDVQILLQCNGTTPTAHPNPTICNAACGGAGILSCGDLNLDGQITTADAVIALNESSDPSKNVVPACSSAGPTVPCGTIIDSTDPNNINSNRVLGTCQYFVKGTVFVQPGVVLSVRPGATIEGVAGASTPSALIFLPGDNGSSATQCPLAPGPSFRFSARINAAGTPNSPIIFTSDQPVGSRRSGDWAGVSFNGCSRVNDSGGVSEAEGLVGVTFGGGTDCKPGTNPEGHFNPAGTANCNDSSGLMRYVRVEFAGNELSPDNELNTYTQNGLGAKTNFTYLQAHMGLDDNFEWFGGTIHEKHFVSTGARDDNFDWQLGSDVKLQYGVAAQYLPNLDALSDHGFEGDNNERGFTNLELSTPQFCNITVIGAKGQPFSVPSGGSWYGALLRRGTAGQMAKTIVTNFISGGINLRDPESAQHACTGTCKICNNISTPTGCTSDAGCGGTPGSCATRSTGVTLVCDASSAHPGLLCTSGTSGAVCGASGQCNTQIDCPGSPFTLVDTNVGDKTCSAGANVGVLCTVDGNCPGGTCGFNNLIFESTLFYNNGDGVTTHGGTGFVTDVPGAINGLTKTGGNNTGANCNSHEWFDLLVANSLVKANTTFPDATKDPGIQAGPFWPPISFVPQNAALVADSFDCSDMSGFFETTTYIGALDPAGTDWTQTPGGWISFVTQ